MSKKRADTKSANADDTELSEVQLSEETLYNAIFNELVRARIRNRALITTLEESGNLDRKKYLAAYRQEFQRSFTVLADALFLDPTRLASKHEQWVRQEKDNMISDLPQARISVKRAALHKDAELTTKNHSEDGQELG